MLDWREDGATSRSFLKSFFFLSSIAFLRWCEVFNTDHSFQLHHVTPPNHSYYLRRSFIRRFAWIKFLRTNIHTQKPSHNNNRFPFMVFVINLIAFLLVCMLLNPWRCQMRLSAILHLLSCRKLSRVLIKCWKSRWGEASNKTISDYLSKAKKRKKNTISDLKKIELLCFRSRRYQHRLWIKVGKILSDKYLRSSVPSSQRLFRCARIKLVLFFVESSSSASRCCLCVCRCGMLRRQ